ncbi:hypothetical protein, partial [Cupriavidus lacunae]|uniref:hypothetical protein n=1 Tax=Cupriavidus lacunae TaxID=2666307 RepID=UPI001ABF7483
TLIGLCSIKRSTTASSTTPLTPSSVRGHGACPILHHLERGGAKTAMTLALKQCQKFWSQPITSMGNQGMQ